MIHVLAGIPGGVMLSERVLICVPRVGSRPTDVSSRRAYHCEGASAVYSNTSQPDSDRGQKIEMTAIYKPGLV
jgi:hypothetical protein